MIEIVYLIGCLASLIFLLIIGGFRINRITVQSLIIVPLYILSSWLFVISMLLFQFFIWLDSITEELDDVVIWEKEEKEE